MTSKFCTTCGAPSTGGSFCTRCGRPAAPALPSGPPDADWTVQRTVPGPPGPPRRPPGPERRRGLMAVLAVLMLLVLGAVAVLVVLRLTATDELTATPGATPTADPGRSASGGTPPAQPAVGDPDNLGCTGQFLVVFEVTNDESTLDTTKPWLQAEGSCAGIDRELSGKPLRFNYLGPFDSADEACAQLLAMDPHSDFVKLLREDQSGGRHYLCSCQLEAQQLPYLRDSGGAYPQDPAEFRAIVDLQIMLKRVQGFRSDNLGLFGPKTGQAVEQFQLDQGLSPTGEVDAATWRVLLGSAVACPA